MPLLAAMLALTGSAAPAADAVPVPVGSASAATAPAGPRRQTLIALVRHLDQTAQGALEGALDEVRHGTPWPPGFVVAIRSFAGDVGALREAVDLQQVPEDDLAREVAGLASQVGELSSRIRSTEGLGHLRAEWEAMVDVIGRIGVLLSGGEVEVPADFVVAPLTGESLRELRQLAHDLDASARLAHQKARRDLGKYPDRGDQFLGELTYFAAQSRALHRLADEDPVHPQELGPVVDHVLELAREADRQMRAARVFQAVWSDSGRIITLLGRMASLVRS